MRQSPRRNGRNKGLRVKHVVQISMLLGVSIWLLYQAHHSNDKKTSVTTNISHNLNNVSSDDDVSKLGRKVLRPKVNGTKEHQADEKGDNENEALSGREDVVEDHESDEHEEDGENEKENGDKGHEESGLENENIETSQRERHEGKQNEELKATANENKSGEENEDVVMEKSEKEVEISSPSKEDDDQNVRDEVENDKTNNGENDDQSPEDDDLSKRPSIDTNEENNKDLSYSLEPNTAEAMKSTWDDKNMKPDIDSDSEAHDKNMEPDTDSDTEAQDKIGESIPSTEFEQKDGVSVLEEEKDALTDLETLPESGTGGSVTQENAATE